MKKDLIPVRVHAVLPTNNGSAVFLGNDSKVFVIYIDAYVATAISMSINGTETERPLTHDLIGLLLKSFGAKLDRIIINDIQDSTYFARIILTAENEILHKKIVELDARPSDSIALACQQRAPIFVNSKVWEQVEDMSDVLAKIGNPETSEEQEKSLSPDALALKELDEYLAAFKDNSDFDDNEPDEENNDDEDEDFYDDDPSDSDDDEDFEPPF